MCSYLTVATEIAGSAKGPQGWFRVTSASVYFDHPFHAPFDHTLNIDFADPARGPGRPRRRRAQRGVGAPPGREHQRGAGRCRGRRLVTTPDRPGGRRPPALGRGARRGAGRGRPGSAAATPDAVRDLSGGFSPGATAVLECPGGAVFVKAVGGELNPDSPELHRREAVVSAALPPAPALPAAARRLRRRRLGGAGLRGGRRAAAARIPGTGASSQAAVRALDALHDALTPSPVPRARAGGRHAPRTSSVAGPSWPPWTGPRRASTRGRAAHLDRLAELESGWPDAVRGLDAASTATCAPTTCSSTGDGVVFVDWPHAAVGTPVFDLVAWAPSVVLEGGPAARRAPGRATGRRARSTPTSSPCCSPPSAASSCRTRCGRHRPGFPTLRPFQAAQGEVALAWLRRRTGW